jgi:hypothetical protein
VYRSLVLLSDLKDLKFCSQHESPDYKILKRTMKSIHVGHGLRKLEVWLLLRVFHSYLPYFCFAWYVRVVQMVAMTEAVIKVVKEIFLGKQARMRARMRSEM